MTKTGRTSAALFLSAVLSLCFPFESFLFPQVRTGSPPAAASFSQGEKLKAAGEFQEALECFRKFLETLPETSGFEQKARTEINLGLLYWNTGDLESSQNHYQKALQAAREHSLPALEKHCRDALEIHRLYEQGKELRSRGRYDPSLAAFDQAVLLAREAESPEHELKCLRQQSVTFWYANRLREFRRLNERALDLARRLNHHKEIGRCSNNIGLYHSKYENYAQALTHLETALQIARKRGNRAETSNTLNNMGVIYKSIGNYEKALDYLTQGLEIDRELGDDVYISADLNDIGTIYRHLGLSTGDEEYFQKALEHFHEGLSISQKIGETKNEIFVLNNIGSVYSDLERYYDALTYFRQGLEKARSASEKEAVGMLLNNMGIVHSNQGNYEESTLYFQQAIDQALEIRGGRILWEAYLELAHVFHKQNQLEEALKYYQLSISIIEDVRSRIELEELKASYLGTDKRIEAYHSLIDLLIKLHRRNGSPAYAEQAFKYLEKGKARAFLDRLEVSQVDISQHIDFKLQNQEREIMKDISAIYNRLLDSGLTGEESRSIQDQLRDKEHELETLKREIRTRSPAYGQLKYPEIITLEEARSLLEPGEAFFEYCLEKDTSHLFVITQKELSIYPLPPRDKIQDTVRSYLKAVTDRENRSFPAGRTLFQILVEPGLNQNIDTLIVVPDDILNYLPFEALLQDETPPRWLIEDYKIAYSPSISSLREIVKRKNNNGRSRRKDWLAFGDPDFAKLESRDNNGDVFQNFTSSNAFNFFRLTYSGQEIERIQSLFPPSRVTVFTRGQASEQRIKNHDLEDYKIIHFATHSLIDDQLPIRSSVVLSLETGEEDGFLQAREIYNLKMTADLVVLSACQTALGRYIRGEGIEGLNRAFFYAGASSLLMSLWAVNDQATSQLMERFYTHLRGSHSIRDALRRTKLELIRSDVLSHPYYWAGFIATGKTNRVIYASSYPDYLWYGLAAAVLAAGFFVLRKRGTLSKRL
ncbi:MAG: CHAT domain-containing protein [Candidatus Aminicenantes bacterium]